MNPKDEVKFEDIKKLVFSSLKELTKEEVSKCVIGKILQK